MKEAPSEAPRECNADMPQAVRAALSHPLAPGLSDRQIAEHCGVGGRFLAAVASTVEAKGPETEYGRRLPVRSGK